jgi:hypothetical protein
MLRLVVVIQFHHLISLTAHVEREQTLETKETNDTSNEWHAF